MLQTVMFATGASLPLLLGALIGVRWRPPQHLVATLVQKVREILTWRRGRPVAGGRAWTAALRHTTPKSQMVSNPRGTAKARMRDGLSKLRKLLDEPIAC